MRKLFVLLALAFGLVASIQAQTKCAHLNLGNLLSLMPESTAANSSLEKLQDSLVTEGEARAKAFQEKYIAFATAMQDGTLTPVQQQEQGQALEQEQQQLAQLEQIIPQIIEARRQELLVPIVQKAQAAIAEVAKVEGYDIVLDTSVFGAVLFAEDSVDLLSLMKTKMGLN